MALDAPADPTTWVRMSHPLIAGSETYATRDAYRGEWYAKGWRSTLDDPLYVGPPAVVIPSYVFDYQLEDYVTQVEFDAQGPSGRELDYAQFLGALSTNTTKLDITDCVIDFTVAARPVHVWGIVGGVHNTVAGQNTVIELTDAANAIKNTNLHTSSSANESGTVIVFERITTPGTYTRKLRLLSSSATAGSGAINITGGYGGARIFAEEK